METVINSLRGNVRLEAVGPFPERFLNICAANGVGFWGVERLDDHTLRVSVAGKDFKRAEELAARAFCTLTVCARKGMPFFLARFRKRYALLVGMVLSLITVCLCSHFVLVIQVTGNEQVTEERVISALRANGFGIGSFGPLVQEQELAHLVLEDVEELAYFTLRLHGVRAEVVVRERIEAPEVIDESKPADLYAVQGGLITQVREFAGTALVEEGDTVAPGDLLISGTVEYPSGTDPEVILRTDQVRANGEVWARTWRTLSVCSPLTAAEKEYTGRTVVHRALRLGEKRLNFYHRGGISFTDYDKITTVHCLTLNGLTLPLAWETEVCSEYQKTEGEVDRDELEAQLTATVTERLNAAVGQEGQVLHSSLSVREEAGLLVVTVEAECLEQIGAVTER